MTPPPDGWVTQFAPAKINLTLHITGRRDDGYHLLDSLVAFADIGDTVRLRPALQMSLAVTGPMAAGVPSDASNLVWKAAELFGEPVEIELFKRLPSAAGIGGGSSDAAATLRALSTLFDRDPPDTGTILGLGADVPVCMHRGLMRMQGIGERLSSLPSLPADIGVVLINPGVAVPTGAVFGEMDSRDNPAMPVALPHFQSAAELGKWLTTQRNDLEHPATQLAPQVNTVLTALRGQSPLVARMSGSGATCFAVYSTGYAAKVAAEKLGRQNPDWWVASGALC